MEKESQYELTPLNNLAISQSIEVNSLLEDIFGFDSVIKLRNEVSIPLIKSIESIISLSTLYQSFVNEYIELTETYDWNEAWEIFFNYGMSIRKQRFPIIIQEQYKFAHDMKQTDHDCSELDSRNIEDFYTFDLKKINKDNNERTSLYEKPLFKLDKCVFVMPFVLGKQNLSTSIINNLLNIHFNRTKQRKDEVHRSEEKLAFLFSNLNFKVMSGYLIPNSNLYDIGDVDLICCRDNYLFVLELKSTYIRTSMENIWIYKSQALRKASNQLNKRKKLIRKLIKEENKEFIIHFGKPKKIISLIIDTSFEFDHEYFEQNLKISMFELINLLNIQNDELYPNGFTTEKFVENIYSNLFWKKFIDKDILINPENTNYKILIEEVVSIE